METSDILTELKKITSDFDLEYKENWFSYVTLKSRKFFAYRFLRGCPHPDLNRFGEGRRDRFHNLKD